MIFSSKQQPVIPLLAYSLLLATWFPISAFSQQFLNGTCYTDQGNYTTSNLVPSDFQKNLDTVLSSVPSNAAQNSGFFYATSGQGTEATNAIAQCRGDLSSDDCLSCLTNASKQIVKVCPSQKAAFVVYETCTLRYSNNTIYGIRNELPGLLFHSGVAPAGNVTAFSEAVQTVMLRLLSKAAFTTDLRRFATGTQPVENTTIYALMQCSGDLSSHDCWDCFIFRLSDMKNYSMVEQISPSCRLKYDVTRFYQITKYDESQDGASLSPGPAPALSPQYFPPTTKPGKKGLSNGAIIGIVVGVCMLVAASMMIYYFRARRRSRVLQLGKALLDIPTEDSLRFDLRTIATATKDFSDENKLGQGGFGEVHKGVLEDGRQIAVKRLSRSSTQGEEEFKNEVMVVAKLQHKNLARLIGFCLERDEKILIYEFVPNKSLDYFLFDPEKRRQLDWSKRVNIIRGIAKGIMYLHEDSRLKIIHRDLKSSNILLDTDMNPKISDFGMARIFGVDQAQANTNRIVGTYGYMSPEYAMRGEFSVKSDVYSFGVLLLEIISGRKNNSFHQIHGFLDLISYVWKHWIEERALEVLDPTLASTCSSHEVVRSIHIGLLCVQEDPTRRPAMALVIMMLNGLPTVLPSPRQPGFFPSRNVHGTEGSESGGKQRSTPWTVNEASISELYPR